MDGQTKHPNGTIEAYLLAFVNVEKNDLARLLPMAEFGYNNTKNASIGHTPFELNCSYHPQVFYKEDIDPCSKSKSAAKFSLELQELISICHENFYHAQKLQKRAHNLGLKPRSYVLGNKIWLNSKYIKIKRNQKLETRFFGLFRVLDPVGRHASKLELPKRLRIHDMFHMSLLEQNITKKGRVVKNVRQIDFDAGNNQNREYEVETIWNSMVYARESASHLPKLYYLVFWKSYLEKNTWKLA